MQPDRPHRFLFILHELSRTGAPVHCLSFMRWIRRTHPEDAVDIFAMGGGELEKEFAAAGHLLDFAVPDKEVRMPSFLRWLFPRLRLRLLGQVRRVRAYFIKKHRMHAVAKSYDCTVCLSVSTTLMIPKLKNDASAVVLWFQELEFSVSNFIFEHPSFPQKLHQADKIIASGEAVRDNLVENYGIDPAKVENIPTFVDAVGDPALPSAAVRRGCGIPADAHVVTAVAWLQWRKGPDLFLRMARHLPAAIDGKEVHLVWVGNATFPWQMNEMKRRTQLANLERRMHFVGHQADAASYIAASDVFVLPSREDPYPLVLVEAALLKRPIVAFAGSGGAEEFLRDDGGVIVPYGDARAMARAVETLLRDPALRQQYASRIRARAEGHLTDVLAPRMYASLLQATAQMEEKAVSPL